MTYERTSARAFHDAEGVEDWRVLYWGAYAHYRVGSFGEGARFVAAIAGSPRKSVTPPMWICALKG